MERNEIFFKQITDLMEQRERLVEALIDVDENGAQAYTKFGELKNEIINVDSRIDIMNGFIQ